MPLIQFPEGFLWGAGSSAWQIEGAISEGGRGRSIWDVYAGRRGRITGGQTADVACDHYNRVTADIELMRDLGLQAYRFSIAWPRIYPTGREKAANEVGLAHYERLVDGLLEAGIEPWITLYHWDLPQGLEDAGGWPARGTVSAFLRYVDTVARRLGDRVHRWITVHDPWAVSMLGYQRGEHAPGRTSWPSALGAAHHLLLAHGKAVQCIRSRAADSAVGISLGLIPTYAGSDREEDQAAAVAFDGQVNRWFLDPLFGRD